MALTGQGGQSGGPRYGWGGVQGDPGSGARSGSAGSRTNFNSGLNSGRYTNGPEAGMRRGEWQWRGHGPSAQRDYGWDYQGGVGLDDISQRTEARTGGSYLSHMAQDRSGGLPRYNQDYDVGDRWFSRLGQGGARGYARDFGRGGRGGYGGGGTSGGGTGGGYGRGGRYEGFRSARGGGAIGGFRGSLAPAFGGEYEPGMGPRGYGREPGADYDDAYRARGGHTRGGGNRSGYDGGYDAGSGRGFRAQASRGGARQVTYGLGPRQSGGGGGYAREFGQGRGLSGRGGGYGADYPHRLTDAEFYSRVDRW